MKKSPFNEEQIIGYGERREAGSRINAVRAAHKCGTPPTRGSASSGGMEERWKNSWLKGLGDDKGRGLSPTYRTGS